MENNKIFLASKTLWGLVIMALPVLLPMIGVSFGIDDTAIVNETMDKIFQAIGMALALWGRFSAKTALTATGK